MRLVTALILGVCLAAAQPTALTLRQALDSAAAQNPTIQLARLQALEAEHHELRTRSAYQPQLNVQVATAYQTSNLQGIGLVFPGFPSRIGPYRTFNARPVLTQTVLDLSLLSEIKATQERTRELRHQTEAAREAILYATLQLYLQALEAGSRVTAAEARVRTAEAVRAQTADREQVGTNSKLDLERAEQQLADEGVILENARRDRDTLLTLLLRTAGMEQGDTVLAEVPAPRTAVDYTEALAQALRQRPEVRALETRLGIASLERQAAERQRWPRVTALADYGLLGAGPDQSIGTYNVGGAVTIPLWTGKRIESEIAAASVRRRQTEARLRDLKLDIAQEVRRAQLESESSARALQAAGRSVRAARETLELVRLRQGAGLATSLDTIVAQGALAQAEDQEIRSRYQLQLAHARLARARGDVYSFMQ